MTMHFIPRFFITAQIPFGLNKLGGYEHREALFGNPPYGRSITQPLYYADSDLCDATVNDRKGYPTRPLDDSGQMEPWPAPFILMMDRGGCTFVQKVRNAQHAGAAGVVIADNICICSDTECMSTSEDKTCEQSEPIMLDDGSGGDISIPAMLMLKHDADDIKKNIIDNDLKIQLQMGWSLPQPDDNVEYELWTSPSEHSSKDFQKKWRDIAPKFGDRIAFTPRQYIYDGARAGCRIDGVNVCGSLCTNGGQYCALDPDGDTDNGISGADVVTESLRRICIWTEYGKTGVVYMDYINEFVDNCDSLERFTSQDCIQKIFKRSKIDKLIVDNCMSNSGGTLGFNSKNNLLDLELEAQEKSQVIILPTIFVNKKGLRGTLNINNVVNAICAGFLEGAAPGACAKCSACGDNIECIKNDGICPGSTSSDPTNDSDGVSKRFFGLLLLTMCSLFGFGMYIHWKSKRKEMQDNVRAILSEYMPLEGGDNEMVNQR